MMETLLTIRVRCHEAIKVEGKRGSVVMIPFEGEAEGPLFRGSVTGPGVDTQRWDREGRGSLSARYMLEGRDRDGNACRIFIENQGNWETGFRPTLVTDSPLLAPWEDMALTAQVEGVDGGVRVTICAGE